MKKLLFLLVTASLAFTGCIKEIPDPFDKVRPGYLMYLYANNQMIYTMQPADYAMRLAVLLAEADKQEKTDLDKIVVKVDNKDVNVKDRLFGSTVKLEKQENGDYKITFTSTPGQNLPVYDGVMTVKTGGKQLSETSQSDSWMVTTGEEFTFKATFIGYVMTTKMTGGETVLYAIGDGSYAITPLNIRFGTDLSTVEAAWSGLSGLAGDYTGSGFKVTPPKEGLAYSDCTGKFFTMTGAVGGPSAISLDGGKSATKMMYEVSNGKYIRSLLVGGNVVCRLTGSTDYDRNQYVSDFVLVDYVLNEATSKYTTKITYNGNVYPR